MVQRTCLYNTGPPSYSLIASAVRSISGEVITNRIREQTTSMERLMNRCSMLREYSLVSRIGVSNTCNSSEPTKITSDIFGITYTRIDCA